ncbi:MAG: drug/metabolite transporter (DMT)-like permease [Gammaproteobacteria bacterium]|jgi:drug/metabolite transporter (DMT)-like permease
MRASTMPATDGRLAAFAFSQSPSFMHAVILMILGTVLLTLNDAATKWLTQTYPITQVWCLRTVFVVMPILLVIAARGQWAELRPRSIRVQLSRGGLFAGTTLLIVVSLSVLPLVDVIAIVSASPLVVAALGPLVLRERTGWARWLAMLAGFVGVLLIVKPGGGAYGWLALLPVAAAVGGGVRDMYTRFATRAERSIAILFWSGVMVVIVGAGLAPWSDWQPVAVSDWLLFALNGFLNGGAHFLIIEALRRGEASLVVPFKYTGLLWGLLFGYVLWAQIPDRWTAIGALLVVIGCVQIARVERATSTRAGKA